MGKIKNWMKEHQKEIGCVVTGIGAGIAIASGVGLYMITKNKSGEDLVYVIDDAIDFIASKTGYDANVVADVLIAEDGYMRSVGIIAE